MVEINAIQKLLFVGLVIIFAISVSLALASGQSLFIALFWSFMNIIGASFPPTQSLADPRSLLLLIAATLDIQGRLIITIILTTIFYQLLGRINLREGVVERTLNTMSKHIIIVPIDGIASELTRKLKEARYPFVVIETNPRAIRKIVNLGMLGIAADPSAPESLERAGIKRAAYLMLLDEDDVKNTLIAIEAKRLNPKIKIIARIKRQDDIARMRRAGIERLILPEAAIGDQIAQFVTKDSKSI